MSKGSNIYGSHSNIETTTLKTIMLSFKCDLDPEDEVIHAIQTILKAISCRFSIFMLFYIKKTNE